MAPEAPESSGGRSKTSTKSTAKKAVARKKSATAEKAATMIDEVRAAREAAYEPISVEPAAASTVAAKAKPAVRERAALESTKTVQTAVAARTTHGVRQHDISGFLRQLIMLLEAGTPMLKSLKTLETRGEHGGIRNLVNGIREYVEHGNPLWQAFARESKYFTQVEVNLIKAAEASGTLTIVLERITTNREQREMMVKRVRAALLYPVILVIVCLAVLVVIAKIILPSFEEIFKSFDIPITGFAAIVTGVLAFIGNYWWGFAVLAVGLWAAYRFWWVRDPVRRVISDRLKLRIPLFGRMLRDTAIVDFMRTLGLMLRSGLSMMVTLDLCRNAVRNRAYIGPIQEMRSSVERGEGLEGPMRRAERHRLLPGVVVDMLLTGEDTGTLDEMAERIADRYEEEVKIAVLAISETIQPVLTVMMGAVVAAIAFSFFGPLIQMIEKISSGVGV